MAVYNLREKEFLLCLMLVLEEEREKRKCISHYDCSHRLEGILCAQSIRKQNLGATRTVSMMKFASWALCMQESK